MKILCYCGEFYESDEEVMPCPRCGKVAVFPKVTDADEKAMMKELEFLLKYPGLADDPGLN